MTARGASDARLRRLGGDLEGVRATPKSAAQNPSMAGWDDLMHGWAQRAGRAQRNERAHLGGGREAVVSSLSEGDSGS